MANLFALRATDPRIMKEHSDPIGPDNNYWLEKLGRESEIIVAAWGNHGGHLNRDRVVVGFMPSMKCLGITKKGRPRHPLYVRADTSLERMVYHV